MLQKVPYFSVFLTPDDWGAVLGCNRSCRETVHNFASTIFLESLTDVAAVLQGQWPHLTLIVLCGSFVTTHAQWHRFNCKYHVIANIALNGRPLYMAYNSLYAVALVVISKSRYQSLTQELVQGRIADACQYLWNEVWQQLHWLKVTFVHELTKVEVTAQLAAISWPNLRQVDLGFLKLGSQAVAHLAKGSWPLLEELHLPGNKLDAAAAESLCTGDWPELQTLNLCHNHLDDAAMRSLAEGQWPKLAYLMLNGNPVSAWGVAELKQGNWVNLRFLSLCKSDASATMCQQLQVTARSWLEWGLDGGLSVRERSCNLPRHVQLNDCWPVLKKVCFVPSSSDSLFVSCFVALRRLAALHALGTVSVSLVLWSSMKIGRIGREALLLAYVIQKIHFVWFDR